MSHHSESRSADEMTRKLLELFAHKESRRDYLEAVVKILHEWSGCRCVGIRILDESGRIPYDAYVGFTKDFWRHENDISIHCDNCFCIRAITRQHDALDAPLITLGGSIHCNNTAGLLDDLSAEQRKRYRGECIRCGFRSLAIVPIIFREQSMGAIHLADERPDMVGDEVIAAIESICVLIGEAIHRFNIEEALRLKNEALNRQADRLRKLGIELTQAEQRERRRIAEMLHDHLQQLLVGARYGLSVTQRRDDLEKVREAAQEVDSIIMEAITMTRSLNAELDPPVLRQHGLAHALEWLAGSMRDMHGLTVTVELDSARDYRHPAMDLLLFQCVRELLFNTVKHSGVTSARVSLTRTHEQTEIDVIDDGAGFDPKLVSETGVDSGFGLHSIRERMGLLGGRFEIDSAPGKGARFRLFAPMHSVPEQQSSAPPVQLAPVSK